MENTVLVNYVEQLKTVWSSLSPVLGKHSDIAEVASGRKSIEEIYRSKLADLRPEIMVYGIYNAGKSSIINELIQSDRAAVSDRPMTDKVDYYEWNGYRLADTPGVGAPIEHENVTQEHLKQADIVLFVMTTSGSNERRQNYERMKDIADAGKKIIIVLNDKDGFIGKDEAALAHIKQKINENMKSLGISNASGKYTIVAVNAKRAHKGRTENKPVLVEKSNIGELQMVMQSELKKTQSFSVMHNSIVSIERELDSAYAALESSGKNSAPAFQKKLAKIHKYQQNLTDEISDFIDSFSGSLGRDFGSSVWNFLSSPDAGDENTRQARIGEIFQTLTSSVVNKLRTKVEDEIRQSASDVLADISELSKLSEGGFRGPGSAGTDFNEIISAAGTGEQNPQISAPEIKADTQQSENSAGAGLGSMIAGPQIGKILGTAVSKLPIIGVLGPYIGPIITVASVVYGIFSMFGGGKDKYREMRARAEAQNEAARRAAEEKERQEREVLEKCRYSTEDWLGKLKEQCRSQINQNFEALLKPVNEGLEKSRSDFAAFATDCEAIKRAKQQYADIDSRITAAGGERA